MVLTSEAVLSDGAVHGGAGVMCSLTTAAVTVTVFVSKCLSSHLTRTSPLFYL